MQTMTYDPNVQNALSLITKEDMKSLTRSQLVNLVLGEQALRLQAINHIFKVEGLYIKMKALAFEKKSEKSPKKPTGKNRSPKKKDKVSKKPSERYPDAEVEDIEVEIMGEVTCEHCHSKMKDSGLRDTSEVVTVIPKKFKVQKHHHVQYKCPCCSHIKTTPRVPKVKPGSSYSDEMIIDVAVSKYCDLIPMNRYSAQARRDSMMALPPNSLIELTHYLAHFASSIEDKIRQEVLDSLVLRADETPHRMFEQEKKSWYLWGFSTDKAAFFSCEPSRNGDVAEKILKGSKAHYLVSDAYAGYSKAIELCNQDREQKITEVFCNSHARRKFKVFDDRLKEFNWIIRAYAKIYMHEKKESPDRKLQDLYFRFIKRICERFTTPYSLRSEMHKAANYFLKHYKGLTVFMSRDDLPIDNNAQERLLRSPVIGRKTWLGTHSLLGGKTAATLFSIIESCKLNHVNPREYLKIMVKRIHQHEEIITPSQAAKDFPQIVWRGSLLRKKD